MRTCSLLAVGALLALSACDRQPATSVIEPTEDTAKPVETVSPPHVGPDPMGSASSDTAPAPLDAELVLREWRKAENREACAPLAFTSVGGGTGTARRAQFGGGWAVAYDQPGLRSAYGLAGTGLLDEDSLPVADQRARLARQWPLFRDLTNLPTSSFAGYGVEGAGRYPPGNPDGNGVNSLAYLRIGGQRCTYNVWSRLGRAHLEHLLEKLTVIGP